MIEFKQFLTEDTSDRVKWAQAWYEKNKETALEEFQKMFPDQTSFIFTVAATAIKVREGKNHVKPIVNGKDNNWWTSIKLSKTLDDKSWWNRTSSKGSKDWALRITAGVLLSNIVDVEISTGSSGKGFGGSEGEEFWEYITLQGLLYSPDDAEDRIDQAGKHLKLSQEKIDQVKGVRAQRLVHFSSGLMGYIKKLVDGTRDFDIAPGESGWLWKDDLKKYYNWMIARTDKIKKDGSGLGATTELGQKENTADAILIDTKLAKNRFWETTDYLDYTFVPKDDYVVEVSKLPNGEGDTTESIGKFIQVSMKKGLKEAQGGGTVDTLKSMEVGDGEYAYSSSIRGDIVKYLGAQYVNEGVVRFIKGVFKKLSGLVGKLWAKASSVADRISKAFTNSRLVSKLSSDIIKDLGKSVLGESYLVEGKKPTLEQIYGELVSPENISNTISNLQKKQNELVSAIESHDPTETILSFRTGSMSKFKDLGRKDPEKSLSMCVLNLVALTVINNMIIVWKPKDGDKDAMYKEMVSMVINTKVGNTTLPLVELYGDSPWAVYDRSKLDNVLDKISDWEKSASDTTKSVPMIINYYRVTKEDGGELGTWNIVHFYYLKDMSEEDGEFTPHYFKMTLRSSGLAPKLNSSLDGYVIDGEYRKNKAPVRFTSAH